MDSNNQFQYIYANLSLYQFHEDWAMVSIVLIGGIILMAICYLCIRYFSLYSVYRQTQRALAKKKKTLGDLILMKDIQTELEKEMEQALLKAAFHS